MSDPVANVEIEDVLTSIRRLVSESGRPAAVPKERQNVSSDTATPMVEAEPEPEEPQAMDRLVLTPAQRIPEVEEEPVEPEAAELLLHPVVEEEPEPLVEEVDEDTFAMEEVIHEDTDVLEDETPSEFDPDEGIALSDALAMDSRIVRWETLNPDENTALIEPDSPGDSDYAGTDVRGLSWIEPLDETEEVAAEDASGVEIAEQSEEGEEQSVPQENLEMPYFLRSGAVEVADEIAEPEGGDVVKVEEAADLAPEAEPFEGSHESHFEESLETVLSNIEAEAAAYAEASVEEAIAPELEDFDADDAEILDEAMLRELVSDIVRQELQGALGERITRNVRKLVRREIHRALAAHDLE